MFKPNYSITPDILNNLIKTAEAKALLDNAYLVPKWEEREVRVIPSYFNYRMQKNLVLM